MNFARLTVLFLALLTFRTHGLNLKGDYAEAVNLSLNQKYTFKNSAVGFGREQEYLKGIRFLIIKNPKKRLRIFG